MTALYGFLCKTNNLIVDFVTLTFFMNPIISFKVINYSA